MSQQIATFNRARFAVVQGMLAKSRVTLRWSGGTASWWASTRQVRIDLTGTDGSVEVRLRLEFEATTVASDGSGSIAQATIEQWRKVTTHYDTLIFADALKTNVVAATVVGSRTPPAV